MAGPRIDVQLAAVDRAMGVDWPALMAFVAHYPVTNAVLQLVYLSVLPQIALLIVTSDSAGKPSRIYSLVPVRRIGAAISIAVWTAAPSFGAFSVYELPASVSEHLALALDGRYAKELIALLAHGPGTVSPTDAKGLIGFPSYHAALALHRGLVGARAAGAALGPGRVEHGRPGGDAHPGRPSCRRCHRGRGRGGRGRAACRQDRAVRHEGAESG